MESAIYRGKVFHHRYQPKTHKFDYNIYLMWLKLSEVEELNRSLTGFSSKGFAPVQFKRQDYLGDSQQPLQLAIQDKMSELAGTRLQGEVFMLGQLRNFGMYFSPVNFYFLRQSQGHYSHMLAEVSNTPWNQRHYYLVNLDTQQDQDKAFHVSPFNPMDMVYHWQIRQPGQQLALKLTCSKQARHFEAALQLQRVALNSRQLFHVLLTTPSMVIKTLVGIHWQALKLFLKRVPLYTHPDKQKG